MKTFAIFTFLTFLVCLSVKLYSNHTHNMLKISLNESGPKDIFEIEPEKARELLDTLDAVTFSDEASKTKTNGLSQIINSKKEQIESKQKNIKEIESLKKELITAFTLPEDNIDEIYELQSNLRDKTEEYELLPNNLEVWGPDFIFYLVIKEGYSFDSLDDVNGVRDLGFNADEIIKIKRVARSNKFMLEILLYKNAISDDEYYQSLAIMDEKSKPKTEQFDDYGDKIDDEEEALRSIANVDNSSEFADYRQDEDIVDLESKLLEEDYDPQELEEIKHGYEESEEYN